MSARERVSGAIATRLATLMAPILVGENKSRSAVIGMGGISQRLFD